MKKNLLPLAVISGLLITMSATVNAQWTRNAATNQTYLTNTGDNVGIGLTNPAFKLDIFSNTGAASMNCKSTVGNSNIIIDRANSASTAGVNYRTNGVVFWQTGTIGTDNFAIRNNQLGSPAVSIQSTTNNVGIGTTAPTSLLQVGNSSGAVTTPTAITMDNTYSSTGGFDKLKFYLYKSATESYGLGLGTAGDMQYWAGTTSTGTHRFFTSQQERMRISANGNVGIGTTTPGELLVINTTGTHATAVINANGGGNLALRSYNNSIWPAPLNASSAIFTNSGHLSLGTLSAANLYLFTNNGFANPAFVLNTAGNVSIGTVTAATGYKLTVAGGIICTNLKVQVQPFPDYVFAKDYNLKSISEVEDHIKTYNRLPGMPSACEVEDNGMDVGVMQAKVVEKVEELTLYIIQQQKQIEELKAQVNSLKK